ncbi:LTA synthase family protein [Enterococcus hirae]|uniref:Sulfatase N-terminal domain-containing protein n=1 Tax=Enterococcus hirae TaxID=1354 RepID=A0AB37IIR6_ENTHR|nr:LTA synthase family protein [Enterococcus hirae]EMF0150573.1 LTA synthase family protein [Enterococcus hirae]EMF0384038.1 LTA synthase family protein [Enterococcus hirae]EMF0426499.1 LTA synthase family protein [Enterococcus hirae]EMF0435311.1 LTA synthase family protein [Enterococcus hirae]EMF0532029.1 LTA synthase family protein [Enterococcus hirae]
MKRHIKDSFNQLSVKQKNWLKYTLVAISIVFVVGLSNLYLQWCQNDLSFDLAVKFAFSWHTEKFLLACLVLLMIFLFLVAVLGSFLFGTFFYLVGIGILGYANYLKMTYRQEPIYPDDLKMIKEFGLLKDMTGTISFYLLAGMILLVVAGGCWAIYRSFKKDKKFQAIRVITLFTTIFALIYISHFNNPNNLLRKAYNKTALWIPYSQKMNYYNTGFIGGFLYNLKIDPMEKPKGYSEEKIKEITSHYQKLADEKNKTASEEQPNIIYVMSESFSDPSRLNGVEITGDPLADYYAVADQTYSGQMLSQNYGGGTANIEFEALTGFSMGLFNAQLTTPYTMLVPKMNQLPSIVSTLKDQNYHTTAIHPYNTSMYKRKDVYEVLGFDEFISENTMTYTDTIEDNPYISDASAYQEVMDLLKEDDTPQFIHLVTMQTHMPYDGKYQQLEYTAKTEDNSGISSLENYLQDISYSSQSLKAFTEELKKLSRRTLVVFWGDHLPGIYSDTIQNSNEKHTLHETQFLMFDSQGELEKTEAPVTSPFYFAADLMNQTNQQTTGFYQLLLALQNELPAFERELYYQEGQWHREAQLNKKQAELYQAYEMIQYDIVSGEKYSLQTNFFEK